MHSLEQHSKMMNRPLYQQQDPELRRLKEAFVSNLQGTTRWEVFCVLSSLPLCLLTAAYIEARLAARLRSSSLLSRKQQWHLPKFPFEFCGVVLPILMLVMSVAPAEPAFLLLFLLWGSLALKLWMRLAHGPASRQHMAHMLQHMARSRKRFVSAFRGGVMVATCLAILGVDFPAFPRRYAKAEGYGGGVMDVGVGAIVFAGGLVSAVAAGAAAADAAAATAVGTASGSSSHSTTAAVGKGGWSSTVCLRLSQLLRGIKAAIPLLLLGGAREIATAFVGYQAHLGEYGLNWNFFYTIAAVTLLTLAVPVPPRCLGPLGVGLTAAHQVLLSLDLSKFAASATAAAAAGGGGGEVARVWGQYLLPQMPGLLPHPSSSSSSDSGVDSGTEIKQAAAAAVGPVKTLGAWVHLDLGVEARQAAGFWASNKEGLASLPGYWALYMLGAAIGHQLGVSCAVTAARARAQITSSSSSSSRPGGGAAAVGEAGRLVWAWVGVWWVVDLALWSLLAALESAVEPVSRRTCNLPYVLWTTAQCLAWLLLVVMADLLTSVICSSSGGCGISTGSSALFTPAAAVGHGSARVPVRRSLDAACTAAAAAAAGSGGLSHSGDTAAAAAAAPVAATGQHSPLPPSPKIGLQRRSVGRRGSGSSPMAAAAAAAAALTAAAVGGGSIAGNSTAAVAAAAAAVVDSSQSGSSREGSPRKPSGSRTAAAAVPGGSEKGSPKGGSDNSSGSSTGHHGSGGGSSTSTPIRSRRQQSRLQPPHQQQHQQQQKEEQTHAATSSSSSGGPMRLMLAFNRNMLALFLIANLLTGAVNLSINTLEVGSWAARIIVGVYMLVLCSLAVLLDKKGITLKPW